MVVGALIFVLGIDLVKEALWDTRHRVSRCVTFTHAAISVLTHIPRVPRSEYITIASIIVVMTVWDFVVGVLFGIVVSCKFIFILLELSGRATDLRACRLLLCRAKFTKAKYPCDTYGRNGNVCCKKTRCSSGVHTGGLSANHDPQVAGWVHRDMGNVTNSNL